MEITKTHRGRAEEERITERIEMLCNTRRARKLCEEVQNNRKRDVDISEVKERELQCANTQIFTFVVFFFKKKTKQPNIVRRACARAERKRKGVGPGQRAEKAISSSEPPNR